jgi:type IV secretory pathway VirB4 component
MLRLDRVIKPWKESGALNAHINLFGFWNETPFLTKSGDLGMVMRVSGIDYESLDNREQDYAVKRLESALKGFGPGFHVYQYLFKSNCPDIPFATYDDPLIDAAIDQRREFFRSKSDRLYQIEIFYVILLEGTRSKPGLFATLGKLPSDPQSALLELKARFSSDATKRLLRTEIDADLVKLTQRAENFSRQLADLVAIEAPGKEASFTSDHESDRRGCNGT